MSQLSEQIELVRNTLIQGSKFTRFHKFDPLGAFDEIIKELEQTTQITEQHDVTVTVTAEPESD